MQIMGVKRVNQVECAAALDKNNDVNHNLP